MALSDKEWRVFKARNKVTANYQRITIRSGERFFLLYCTQGSLEHRRDEVLLWADRLARQLHWKVYETTIASASEAKATERKHALFEYWIPAS